MSVNDKVTRDIEFPIDIEHRDFISRVCAVMNLNVATAQLGWKLNDDAKCNPAQQLTTQEDLQEAFRSLLKTKNNPRCGDSDSPLSMSHVRTSNNTAVLSTVTGQSVASSGSEEPSRVPVV